MITRWQWIVIRIRLECRLWQEMNHLDFCRYYLRKLKEHIPFKVIMLILLGIVFGEIIFLEGAAPLH